MGERITVFDEAEGLDTAADIAAYMNAVLEENDSALLVHALGVVARASGLAELTEAERPDFDAVRRAFGSVGLRLHFEAA